MTTKTQVSVTSSATVNHVSRDGMEALARAFGFTGCDPERHDLYIHDRYVISKTEITKFLEDDVKGEWHGRAIGYLTGVMDAIEENDDINLETLKEIHFLPCKI